MADDLSARDQGCRVDALAGSAIGAGLWQCYGMIAPAEPTSSTKIRTLSAAMVVTLLTQLLLGMANTFWLKVPDSGSGWNLAAPAGLLMAHVILGAASLVLAVWMAVSVVRSHDRFGLIASGVGILGILIGFGGGIAFMSQTSNNGASFLMAVGTSIAIAGYALGFNRLDVGSAT